ncbi:PLP-dependent aminotransferase family protein [Paenibacillus sp. GCM10012306]|uniref:aminotransferase-like domain-containing protein n=1 Tax=Paenibacillus sp. GCM10012306 TaxID=3317342 RepID=UPI0036184C83
MNIQYSAAAQNIGSSVVREILKVTQGTDVISLAGGLPAEELFPVEAVQTAYNQVLSGNGSALQYGITEGFTPLREQIAERLAHQGIPVSSDEIILTTGSQQAIDLISRILLDPGDAVLVETPTYLAALQSLNFYRADIHIVDHDSEGMIPEDLEEKLRRLKPKLLYTVPTFNNPSGATWSKERRLKIVELCQRYGTLILEDNPYGELRFTSDPGSIPPTLAAIDRSSNKEHCVIYTGTFSKIVAPALRTGWIVADPAIVRMVAKAKQTADLHSSAIDQRALHRLLQTFDIERHIASVSREYHARMKLLSQELLAQGMEGLSFREPLGGMFLWLTLPAEIDTTKLLPIAMEHGVAFVPGEVFYPSHPEKNTMRLNFTHTPPQLVQEGVQRLMRAIVQWREHETAII